MAARRDTRPRGALATSMKANMGQYLLVVTGSVPLAENGIYTHHRRAGPRRTILEEAAAGAAAVIAVGACAHWGSVQAAQPNPTGAVGVREIIKDKPVVHHRRLPADRRGDHRDRRALPHLRRAARSSTRDGRPLFAYGARIHDQCPRRGQLRRRPVRGGLRRRGAPARAGACTRWAARGRRRSRPCPIFQWNMKTSWPIGAGHPCIGCTERNFWDTMTPFYNRLPDVAGFGHRADRRHDRRRARRRCRSPASRPRTPTADQLRPPGLPVVEPRSAAAAEGGARWPSTKVVVDPITRIEGHLRIEVAGRERHDRQRLGLVHAVPRHRDSSCRAATRATPGPSPSGSAASAPWCTPWPPAARSRTRSTSPSRPTPT